MKRSRILIIFLLLLMGVCRGQVNALAGELVIGTSTGYPPYYFVENGKLTGICVEVINHTALAFGMQAVYKQYPWKRMLLNGRTGRVDAVMPLFKTPEREQYLLFPDIEIALEENSFFSRKGLGIQFSGAVKDLKSYPIGVVTGYSYGKEFDAADYLQKVTAKHDLNLLQLFKFNRFDVGIGNRHVVGYFAKKIGGINDLVFLEPPVTREPLYVAFSKAKGHEKLAAAFSGALRDFKKTSAYRSLLLQYGLLP